MMVAAKKCGFVLACVILSCFIVHSGAMAAQEAPLKLVFATGVPLESALFKSMKKFEELVTQKSGGKVVIESYHGGQLYEEVSSIEAVLNDTIDLGTASNQNYGRFTKLLTFMDLPYVFDSPAHLRKVLDGPIGEKIKQETEKDTGLKILCMPDNGGARPIYNNKREVRVPADLKGLKIRITASPVEPVLFKAWGASPVAMGAAETFTSIQTGVVDGHSMNWTWAYKLKFFDLLKYAVNVDYLINTSLVSMKLSKFSKLPADIQKILVEAGKETEKYSVAVDAAEVEEALKAAQAKGIKIYNPTEDEFKQWKSIGLSIYDQFKDKADLKLVEEIKKAK